MALYFPGSSLQPSNLEPLEIGDGMAHTPPDDGHLLPLATSIGSPQRWPLAPPDEGSLLPPTTTIDSTRRWPPAPLGDGHRLHPATGICSPSSSCTVDCSCSRWSDDLVACSPQWSSSSCSDDQVPCSSRWPAYSSRSGYMVACSSSSSCFCSSRWPPTTPDPARWRYLSEQTCLLLLSVFVKYVLVVTSYLVDFSLLHQLLILVLHVLNQSSFFQCNLYNPLRQIRQQHHAAPPVMSDQINSHSCRPNKMKILHNSFVMNLLLCSLVMNQHNRKCSVRIQAINKWLL
jgi:hypothetical protein